MPRLSLGAQAAKLDADFRRVTDSLAATDRAAIFAWQRTDRGYELVQQYLRSGEGSAGIKQLTRTLEGVLHRGKTRRPITVWRGLRSSNQAFGLSGEWLRELEGERLQLLGFTAASLSRSVAKEEFTTPPSAAGGALVRMDIAIGTPAIWIAGAGSKRLRRQFEIMLPSRVLYRIQAADYSGSIPVIGVEVGE